MLVELKLGGCIAVLFQQRLRTLHTIPMHRFEAGHIDFAVLPPRNFLRIGAFEK